MGSGSRRERRPAGGVGAELEALLAAGDHRRVAARARAVLGDAASGEPDRAAARDALSRVAPEPGATLAAVAGLVLFAAVAALGLAAR
jgi:hypothetical protein